MSPPEFHFKPKPKRSSGWSNPLAEAVQNRWPEAGYSAAQTPDDCYFDLCPAGFWQQAVWCCSARGLTVVGPEMCGSFLKWRQLSGQTANWRNRTPLEWAYDLLIFRQTNHWIGMGVICAGGQLDFDSAHLTASSLNRGLLPWRTGQITSFLFKKLERCFYCHMTVEIEIFWQWRWNNSTVRHPPNPLQFLAPIDRYLTFCGNYFSFHLCSVQQMCV